MRSSLEAGGAAPYPARRPPGVSGGAEPPPLSRPCPGRRGGRRGLSRACGGGVPAQGLAGPGVELGGDRVPGRLRRARTGRCPWGSTGAAARWCSRCCRVARASAGRRSRSRSPRSTAIAAWLAISLPWSQVSDRRSARGRRGHLRGQSPPRRAGAWPSGRCSSITNRVARSTRVPIADPVARPDDQVALPVPGHSAVLGLGRALADRSPSPGSGHAARPRAPRLAYRPSGPQERGQLPAQPAAGLHVQRLVDRLGRHPHLRFAGEVDPESASDLLRALPLPQPVLDLAAAELRPPASRSSGAPPAPPPAPAPPPPGTPPRALVPPDLPVHRRPGLPSASRSPPASAPPPGPPRSPPAPPATRTAPTGPGPFAGPRPLRNHPTP